MQHVPITYVLFVGSETLETDPYSFQEVQSEDCEDIISLSDKPDLHPDTTITLTEEEKLYI